MIPNFEESTQHQYLGSESRSMGVSQEKFPFLLAGARHPVHDVRGAGVPLDAALVPPRRRPLLHGHGLLHPLLHVPRQLSQELRRQLAPNGELGP